MNEDQDGTGTEQDEEAERIPTWRAGAVDLAALSLLRPEWEKLDRPRAWDPEA
ncbi:hypothetical protein [Streptomyces lichenis]|uniref:Uncharacterized protein n=1 Tax=Streptomyces lichenis TaxID=2306967 RepID=A0ABT0I609_9ACTN|nr:hypothetical protein [Streptomyces lichenis]MCK8676737.1 hypothetical protein [Streptomyces lichenis]